MARLKTVKTIIAATVCTIGFTSSGVCAGGPLCTPGDVSAFLNGTGDASAPFTITGTVAVAHTPGTSMIIGVTDGNGSSIIDIRELLTDGVDRLTTGTKALFSGIAHRADDRRYALAKTYRVLGKHPPPTLPQTSAEDVIRGKCNYRAVRIKGHIVDCFDDEVDPMWSFFVMDSDDHRIYVYFYRGVFTADDIQALGDVTVETTALCSCVRSGARQFLGPLLIVNSRSAVKPLSPAPTDVFDAPRLEDLRHLNSFAVRRLGRRSIDGTVLAVRNDGIFLLRTDDGRIVTIEPSGSDSPRSGEKIQVAGTPQTDIYHCRLLRARWRRLRQRAETAENPVPVSARDLLKDAEGRSRVKANFHGRPVRMRGIVQNSPDGDNRMLKLDDGGCRFTVDEGIHQGVFEDLSPGCEVEVCGICEMETGTSGRINSIPRIQGFTVILRAPEDLTVLKRPPWWTPGRLLAVIATLVAALVGILIWNRFLNSIIERRSRQLAKTRTARDEANLRGEERMRLAVDLHDTLSQNLTGVAMQIDAAEIAARENPAEVGQILLTARRMMQSCRESLRDCLWDLRSRVFEERRLEDALRKALAPQSSAARIIIDCNQLTQELPEDFVHQAVFMIRELVTNAVRHGKAGLIKVSAKVSGETLSIHVTDNGCGFDDNDRPGPADGHFGLLGVEERVRRLGGNLTVESSPGKGTTVKITGLATNI